MKEKRKIHATPIWIISLLISVVEVVAYLLTRSDDLASWERGILVVFVIAFPLLIAFGFYRLLVLHQIRLYAPSDFESDDGFLRFIEMQIEKSPKVTELEELTRRIQEMIEGQPIYKYTKLSDFGQNLILTVHEKDSVSLQEFQGERKYIEEDELLIQVGLLSGYGWIVNEGDIVRLTVDGKSEVDTFKTFVYARYAPSAK